MRSVRVVPGWMQLTVIPWRPNCATSGFFSDTALVCSMMEMGIDHILFSVDYPFAENAPGTEWLKTLPLGPEDTEKLLNGNARRLLKL